ncbi:hypothetical protein SCHPADRAFT_806160, partial [Schizopora paradoxa]
KAIVIISILAKSTNQQCNAFAVVTGLFLHASRASERVVEMLSHSGMSISSSATNMLIHSLSADAHSKLETLMQTHVASLVYDNFDIKFEVHTPSDRNPETKLVHLTSG